MESKRDELAVMQKKRTNIFAKRVRKMTSEQKEARKKRVRAARTKQRKETSEAFYLNHPRDQLRCLRFVQGFCAKGAKCHMIHSEVDREIRFMEDRYVKIGKGLDRVKLVPGTGAEVKMEVNAFGGELRSMDDWTHVVANFDTGAAIAAIPSTLKSKLGFEGGRAEHQELQDSKRRTFAC